MSVSLRENGTETGFMEMHGGPLEDFLFRTIFPQDYAYQFNPTPYTSRRNHLFRLIFWSDLSSFSEIMIA